MGYFRVLLWLFALGVGASFAHVFSSTCDSERLERWIEIRLMSFKFREFRVCAQSDNEPDAFAFDLRILPTEVIWSYNSADRLIDTVRGSEIDMFDEWFTNNSLFGHALTSSDRIVAIGLASSHADPGESDFNMQIRQHDLAKKRARNLAKRLLHGVRLQGDGTTMVSAVSACSLGYDQGGPDPKNSSEEMNGRSVIIAIVRGAHTEADFRKAFQDSLTLASKHSTVDFTKYSLFEQGGECQSFHF